MTESVSGFMSEDHDRLDSILAEIAEADHTGVAASLFLGFDSGLRRHIAWEEEILFPVFEERTGMVDSGPTAVMRMEHTLISRLLEAISLRVRDDDISGLLEDLLSVLGSHNAKEEMILYPWIDEQLCADEIAEALGRMERDE